MARFHLPVAVAVAMAVTAAARASSDDPTADLNAERDALIENIATDHDAAASVKRFAALLDRRRRIVSAAQAALEAQRSARDAVDKSLDARVESSSCDIAIDPPDPRQYDSCGGAIGRLTRHGEIRLTPRNDLDPGEQIKFVEVDCAGVLYHLRLEKAGSIDKAVPGDKVLLCGVHTVNRVEYGEWGPHFAYVGWAARVAGPPTVLKYAAQHPAFVSTSTLDRALFNVRWPYQGRKVFLRAHIAESVTPTRWRVMSGNADFLLDVPLGTPGEKAIAAGTAPWVLAEGQFDPQTRKLLLRAAAVEEHLFTERP